MPVLFLYRKHKLPDRLTAEIEAGEYRKLDDGLYFFYTDEEPVEYIARFSPFLREDDSIIIVPVLRVGYVVGDESLQALHAWIQQRQLVDRS